MDLRIPLALLKVDAALLCIFIILNRELIQMGHPFLILLSKSVNLRLIIADGLQ